MCVMCYNKALHSDSIQLSRFLLKEKAAKTAPTYSPVNAALGLLAIITCNICNNRNWEKYVFRRQKHSVVYKKY